MDANYTVASVYTPGDRPHCSQALPRDASMSPSCTGPPCCAPFARKGSRAAAVERRATRRIDAAKARRASASPTRAASGRYGVGGLTDSKASMLKDCALSSSAEEELANGSRRAAEGPMATQTPLWSAHAPGTHQHCARIHVVGPRLLLHPATLQVPGVAFLHVVSHLPPMAHVPASQAHLCLLEQTAWPASAQSVSSRQLTARSAWQPARLIWTSAGGCDPPHPETVSARPAARSAPHGLAQSTSTWRPWASGAIVGSGHADRGGTGARLIGRGSRA
mmetsp:Transcript_97369/g.275249  ORF Transcript_97369/g.275249 Transcript_97369/m.275249 type:complete len:278 (-) Transcript_97369:3-836(-)